MIDAAPTLADRARATAASLGPGLVLVAGLVVVARLLNEVASTVSALVFAVILGAVLANTVGVHPSLEPGLKFAAKRLLRVGIVLLGFRLSLGDVADLGGTGLAIVAVTVLVTFVGTQWMGRRLGLSEDLSLLVATGFSICGASAVAAMEPMTDAEEEEVAAAIGLVTVFGTLSIITLPLIGSAIGLDDPDFGSWVGAATHDVAQVVAAASTAGTVAVSAAIVVKLTRVVLLAPMVAFVSWRRRATVEIEPGGSRPPLLPLFVAGFLAAVAVRTTEVLSVDTLSTIKDAESILLTAAMVGLGSGVRIAKLRGLGPKPVVLGLLSWVVVAGISLVGVLLTSG
ncbi:MAG: putative sulfate exporter family transporter [Actinomycetota bacterium]